MIINLDCLLGMRTCLADNSIDAVVTDPPYGLSKEPDMMEVMKHWMNGDDYVHTGGGFMGKSWDSFVPGPSIWKEVFRVLKPGGHLLAFFGSRTYDLGTLAIRLAGFEIRDQIMWVYGSGFPKSLDVSKAIDSRKGFSMFGKEFLHKLQDFINDARKNKKITYKQLNLCFGFPENSGMAGHWCGDRTQPSIPRLEHFVKLKKLLDLDDSFDEAIIAAEREIVGTKKSGIANKDEGIRHTIGASKSIEVDITAPATDEAKQWSGWGTALKPAHEPICVARKPLSGTVAENVLTHSTGALNIDGCRVTTNDKLSGGMVSKGRPKVSEGWDRPWMHDPDIIENKKIEAAKKVAAAEALGRWPANFVHDGSNEVLAAFPDAKGQQGQSNDSQRSKNNVYGAPSDNGKTYTPRIDTDTSAARFFYCAKASKADRDDGVSLATASAAEMVERDADSAGMNSPRAGAGRTSGARNDHPTVKPTALMQWLVRLVTPPGGTVLDPFTGSGSTGKACMLEGFEFIGFEMDPHYCEIAEQRIAKART